MKENGSPSLLTSCSGRAVISPVTNNQKHALWEIPIFIICVNWKHPQIKFLCSIETSYFHSGKIIWYIYLLEISWLYLLVSALWRENTRRITWCYLFLKLRNGFQHKLVLHVVWYKKYGFDTKMLYHIEQQSDIL